MAVFSTARTWWICSSCAAPVLPSARRPYGTARSSGASNTALPTSPARTRFAPSPTGYLHLGSLRTALFNYLLAKATGGQFLLRIEDTDQKRTVPDAEARLCQDLQWAGLQWEEGPKVKGPYGPYRQSERTPLYREHVDKLLKSRHAYRCFCSSERLNELASRRNKLGLPTDYDRACAGISEGESEARAACGESHVVRLKVPNQYPDYHDLVYGKVGKSRPSGIMFKHGETAYEDPVLLKSDGLPTYHLANVVDDHHMRITHVIRAAEWISSTPKHLALYEAFDWQPPVFAHVGLLQDQSRQKLSKRNLDLDISAFRDHVGIFPDALVNFVALLGWSHDQKQDVMTMRQLIDKFDLKFTKGNTMVTFEKLWFLQKAHAQRFADEGGKDLERIVHRISKVLPEKIQPDQMEQVLRGRNLSAYIASVFRADAKSFTSEAQFLERNSFFFRPLVKSSYHPSMTVNGSTQNPPVATDVLVREARKFQDILAEAWRPETIKQTISDALANLTDVGGTVEPNETAENGLLKQQKARHKEFHGYLRWALASGKQGPGMADTMEILGRDVTLHRLSEAARLLTED